MNLRAPASTRRLAVLLGGLAMFGPFSIDTIFPAFPQMAAQLGADKLAMQQTISVYLAAYALIERYVDNVRAYRDLLEWLIPSPTAPAPHFAGN